MKSMPLILGATIACALTSCVVVPVVSSTVGPNPDLLPRAGSYGQLEVFSDSDELPDNDDSPWYQHSDYDIYNHQGKLLKHVFNTNGHFDESPRRITLPDGEYVVEARAKDYLRISVPVIILPGQETVVHLDDGWTPLVETPKAKLVYTPNGYPIGWSVTAKSENK
jgi:hypothetical protein